MTQLTKCPGTLSYMPPEALVERPIYSTKIDVFSYGNLMTHVFSGRWPIPAEIFRANPSNPHVMTPLTEVQRREAYLNDIGDAHPLMGLMRECLSNNPTLRPDIPEALQRVKEVMPQFPPSFENKAEVLQRIQADATARASLNAQISTLSAQVEQKEGRLQALTNENATLHTQASDQEGEFRKLSAEKADQFTNFSAQIEQKEGQLRTLSAQLEQLQKRAVEETETLNAAHGLQVERLSVRLDELRAEAEGLRAAVRANEERLSARDQEIAATQEILKVREQEVATKDLALAAKEQQRKEEVAAKVQEVEAAQAIIRSKEEELVLKSQIAATSEQQRKQEVEANSRLLNAKDRDISSLRVEVAGKDATLQAKDSTIASLRSQATRVETLLQRIQTLTDENAALNKRMASLTIGSVPTMPIPGQLSEVRFLSHCRI
jgi:chromosome segregation ATPase